MAGLFTGTSFAYMGYKLFAAGVFERAGELEQVYGKEHLLLKGAAPGTFFALFGCAIVALTLWRRFETNLHAVSDGKRFEFDSGVKFAAEVEPLADNIKPIGTEVEPFDPVDLPGEKIL